MSKPLIGVTCDYDVQKQTFPDFLMVIIGRYSGQEDCPTWIHMIDEGTIPEIIDLLGGISVYRGGGCRACIFW